MREDRGSESAVAADGDRRFLDVLNNRIQQAYATVKSNTSAIEDHIDMLVGSQPCEDCDAKEDGGSMGKAPLYDELDESMRILEIRIVDLEDEVSRLRSRT
jgi:hypothetical protein